MIKKDIEEKIKILETEINILDKEQHAMKILLNAGYGAIANPYFLLFDIRLAKAITYTSQLSIKWIMEYLNKNLNIIKILYSDTDSTFLSVTESLKKLCEIKKIDYDNLSFNEKYDLITKFLIPKIEESIKEGYKILGEVLNVYENTFEMKREIIGDKGLWLAKKSYCIKMIDKEGIRKYEDSKPYVKGFEIAKKSSNSKWIIDILTEYLELIFKNNKDNIIKYEKEKYLEFKKLLVNDFFAIRSVSSLNNYETVNTKGAMTHIKGALVYNKIIKDLNLENSFPYIHQGDKIHFSYIIEPNIFNSNSIAYLDGIDGDKFLNIIKEKYKIEIDYKKQWETIFIHPARRLTDAINWKIPDSSKTNIMSLLKNNC